MGALRFPLKYRIKYYKARIGDIFCRSNGDCCPTCGAPERRVWAGNMWATNKPKALKEISNKQNGIILYCCSGCERLLFQHVYEPYSFYLYLVIWEGTHDEWEKQYEQVYGLREKGQPSVDFLEKWHAAVVYRDWAKGTAENYRYIRRHWWRALSTCPACNERNSEVPKLPII